LPARWVKCTLPCRVAGNLAQWYSTLFVRVPPDIISLQLCTPQSCWYIMQVIHIA
jgi:hypothetical protein